MGPLRPVTNGDMMFSFLQIPSLSCAVFTAPYSVELSHCFISFNRLCGGVFLLPISSVYEFRTFMFI
jgi:hypothetical protein